MDCDCQRKLFDCEEKVRRFLGLGRHEGLTDLAGRDDLMKKMTPLVERIVNSKLQGRWRQDRENVVQEVLLKLCDAGKLQRWLESPKRTWFCHWVAVVASHTAIDWIRRPETASSSSVATLASSGASQTSLELEEQAERLRKCIVSTLGEFELEWQLVFCMKFSYLEPCISDIAYAAKVSEEAVFFRLRKIKERIAGQCSSLLSPAVAKVALTGVCHPVECFERLERSKRDEVNNAIRTRVAARSIKEQFAFYMRYTPLTAPLEVIADRAGEAKETVISWLADIDSQIKRICPGGKC